MNLEQYKRLLELREVKKAYATLEDKKTKEEIELYKSLAKELKNEEALIDELRQLKEDKDLINFEKRIPKSQEEKITLLKNQLYNIPNYSKEDPKIDEVILAKEERDEWLRILHERYSEKFLKDNDRIWTVTSIFIPLSLAGLSSVKDGSAASTVLLGFGSISLMTFWFLVCEKHRAFQENSESIVNLIERQVGLNTKLSDVTKTFKKIDKGDFKVNENEKFNSFIIAAKILSRSKFKTTESDFYNFLRLLRDITSIKNIISAKNLFTTSLRLPLNFILNEFPIYMARVYMLFAVISLWIGAMGWAIYKEDHPNKPDPTTVIIHQWTTQTPLEFPPIWPPYTTKPVPYNPGKR